VYHALLGLVLQVGYVVRTSFRVCNHSGGCVRITVVLRSIILSDGFFFNCLPTVHVRALSVSFQQMEIIITWAILVSILQDVCSISRLRIISSHVPDVFFVPYVYSSSRLSYIYPIASVTFQFVNATGILSVLWFLR